MFNCLGDILSNRLTSSAEAREFDPWPGQSKDVESVFASSPLSIWEFKDWSAKPDVSSCGLLHPRASTLNPIRHVGLVQSRVHSSSSFINILSS